MYIISIFVEAHNINRKEEMTLKKLITANYEIESDSRISDFKGTKFVMISDFHNNDYKLNSNLIIEKVKDIAPFCIIIAGDIITAIPGTNNKRAYALLEQLAKIAPVYMANGNHEYRTRIYKDTYGSMYDELVNELAKNNIVHLINDSVELKKGDSVIKLTGLEIEREYYKRLKRQKMKDDYIEGLVGKADKSKYEILIAHNPKYFKQYAAWGADLVLSGHYHGGIVRIPKSRGVMAPDFTIFPKYTCGLYKEGESKMILSSGVGTHSLKLRIFNPCEIVCFSVK